MFNLKEMIDSDEYINLIKPFINDCECYLVGGYLRDLLSGDKSFDRDLIVKSDVAKSLAKKIADNTSGHFIPLDEENQIYRVVMSDKLNYFDISAMLEDDLEKDIRRRDLTINSMVYDLKNDKVIDIVGAFSDYENRILKTVDLNNFIDDPLRMLRVFRFCAKFNFEIEASIMGFVKSNLKLINKPAKERINLEIMKLFEGHYSENALILMDSCNFLTEIFPVILEVKTIPPNTHHHLDLLHHSIETVKQIQNKYEQLPNNQKKILDDTPLGNYSRRAFLKLAAFLHDIGKPDTWTIDENTGRHRFIMHDEVGSKKIVPILKDLKFSKKQIAYIQLMIKSHIYPSALVWQEGVGSKARLKYYRKLNPYFLDNIILAMADRLSALGPAITKEIIEKNISDLSALLDECFNFDSTVANPIPLLSGTDIMNLTGLPQSKKLGYLVKSVYSAQLDGIVLTKEDAEKFVKERLQEQIL